MMRKINWENWNVNEEEQISQFMNYDEEDIEDEDMSNIDMSMSADKIQGMWMAEPADDLVITPFGIFTSNNPFIPSKRWECWIGHTNFDVTLEEVNTIKKIPGVESLTILGRYTFCIGIPKNSNLFVSSETKLLIEEALCNEKDLEIIREQIGKHKYWAVLVRPDGSFNYAYSKKKDTPYKKQIEKLEHLRRNYGGKIFSSSEYTEF